MTHVDQYILHKEVFDFWIKINEKVPASDERIQPIIPAFVQDNPGVNIHACQECIIDMLRWVKSEWKKTQPKEEKKKK